MRINNGYHLTYCTNIHPGESWEAVRDSLRQFVPPIKERVAPEKAFAIGLRLSNQASVELLQGDHLKLFKEWLDQNDCYVSIINGFPYGGFHRQRVKDDVHRPDWTTPERAAYTKRLAAILAYLLPKGLDGGISTAPLSYKLWYGENREKRKLAFREATIHLSEVVEDLLRIKAETGKIIHIDIEPEPDGFLENTHEVIDYFNHWLLPTGRRFLADRLGIELVEADEAIKNHVRLCYDVCHFALAFEKPQTVLDRLQEEGIQIGRIQISAALKVHIPEDREQQRLIGEQLLPFAESTYLHQVTERAENGQLTHYPDLSEALPRLAQADTTVNKPQEWRTHFHVPIFLKEYGLLQSTQDDIIDILTIAKQHRLAHYLEVETYTWEVLPPELKVDVVSSISRELEWVVERMK